MIDLTGTTSVTASNGVVVAVTAAENTKGVIIALFAGLSLANISYYRLTIDGQDIVRGGNGGTTSYGAGLETVLQNIFVPEGKSIEIYTNSDLAKAILTYKVL